MKAAERIRGGVVAVEGWTPADTSAVFRYVDISSVDRDAKVVTAAAEIPVSEAPSRARQLLRTDDVIVSTVRPNLNAVAMVPRELDGAVGSTGFTVLRADRRRLLPRYLYHWVRSPMFVADMVKKATGASYPAVSDRIVLDSLIPMPDLAEQGRIADILDRADTIRRKRQEAIALTGELLRSAFLETFGDPVTNPRGWGMSTFGAEVSLLEYGPRFYNEKYSDDGVRIVRITDLNASGALDFETMPRLVVDARDRQRYLLQPGDVIFARSGATVGKTALAVEGDPPAIPGAYFIRLRFKSTVVPRYARQVLASESIQQIIVSRSRQSAQQNFSGPGIRELPLPVPPRNLQERLEVIAQGQTRHLAQLRVAEREADSLFTALVTQAFSGNLVAAC